MDVSDNYRRIGLILDQPNAVDTILATRAVENILAAIGVAAGPGLRSSSIPGTQGHACGLPWQTPMMQRQFLVLEPFSWRSALTNRRKRKCSTDGRPANGRAPVPSCRCPTTRYNRFSTCWTMNYPGKAATTRC